MELGNGYNQRKCTETTCKSASTKDSDLRFLEVGLQNPWQHLLQDSLSLQPFILLAPEGEAAGEHAVQQDAAGPDVRHLASILIVQQYLWCNILRSACRVQGIRKLQQQTYASCNSTELLVVNSNSSQ